AGGRNAGGHSPHLPGRPARHRRDARLARSALAAGAGCLQGPGRNVRGAVAMTIAPVRRSVTVEASQQRAFEVFTRRIGEWWPRTHKIGPEPLKSAVLEPRAGGRWYEIGEGGAECEWGRVLSWEEPSRVVLAWQIGADWKFDPALVTEVEIRFIAEGER